MKRNQIPQMMKSLTIVLKLAQKESAKMVQIEEQVKKSREITANRHDFETSTVIESQLLDYKKH